MSSLTWLDQSEADRKRALDFVDTFREVGTRDELGIGVIRDAFSDLMFPGTSTLQTRARYFLFVPWSFQQLERYASRNKARTATDVSRRSREVEAELMTALKKGDDNEGMLGREAGAALKQLPSQIYWPGTAIWGIRRYPGSRSQLHRDIARWAQSSASAELADDDAPTRPASSPYWHDGLPPAPQSFPEGAGFSLTRQEAQYLRDRVLACANDSLLARMLTMDTDLKGTNAPWEHPRFAEFSEVHREQLRQARIFAVVIRGAIVLYNLMLAEKKDERFGSSEDLIQDYEAHLDTWASDMRELAPLLDGWSPRQIWRLIGDRARLAPRTVLFTESWCDAALGNTKDIARSDAARQLIASREIVLKGSLSRIHNPQALAMWNEAAGMTPITYRWNTVRQMVDDIVAGLERA